MDKLNVNSQKVGRIKNYNLEDLKPFQGELKTLTDAAYEKLKTSFLNHGVIAPVFVWNNNILDGHQRVYTLLRMREEGIKVPKKIKGLQIEAKDEKEAKVFLLQYVSQHGQLSEEGLRSFITDAELEGMIGSLDAEINLPNIDLFDLFAPENVSGEGRGSPEIPKAIRSKPGDSYELGTHSLICGELQREHVDGLVDWYVKYTGDSNIMLNGEVIDWKGAE